MQIIGLKVVVSETRSLYFVFVNTCYSCTLSEYMYQALWFSCMKKDNQIFKQYFSTAFCDKDLFLHACLYITAQ